MGSSQQQEHPVYDVIFAWKQKEEGSKTFFVNKCHIDVTCTFVFQVNKVPLLKLFWIRNV